MGIGPFVALGMMGAAMASSSHDENNKSKFNFSFEYFMKKERMERERERRQKERIANEFRKSREKVLTSKVLLDEAKKSGFILTDNMHVGGMYVTYMHGLNEDIRISVISNHEFSSENRETISNALWFLTLTEEKVKFSTEDFKYAIRVGGYSDFPYEITYVFFKDNLLQLHCT